jgi:DNA-binding GntR family transcriptional regulator
MGLIMGAKVKALGRDTTAKVVAGMLRDEIQDGGLAPGTRLRQNEVAGRFGVSTTPVREAFAQLQAEGLVRIDPHRGAVVFHPTAEDLLEYYEIREVLESLAVRHAIERLTPAIAKNLNELIDRMRRTTDARRWLRLNDEFHLKLYECARRPHLSSLIDNLRDASSRTASHRIKPTVSIRRSSMRASVAMRSLRSERSVITFVTHPASWRNN